MKRIVIAAFVTLGLAGCARSPSDDVSRTTVTAGEVPAARPDTSKVTTTESMNESDRSGASPPESSQEPLASSQSSSQSKGDFALAQDIRDAVIADESLSLDAKAVSIAVRDGKVTLRGAVPDTREHDIVLQLARERAGIAWVDDKLGVRR